MAVGKEIKTKIASIRNTAKITKAMELVSTSKMRKTQLRMARGRPYGETLRAVIGHLAQANSEYRHSWMVPRDDVQTDAYLVIGSDRGLCGGFNVNLHKTVVQHMRLQNKRQKFVTIGARPLKFFQRFGGEIIGYLTQVSDKVVIDDLLPTIQLVLEAYNNKKVDRVFVCYNNFVNTMIQTPIVEQLLPLPASDLLARTQSWDYLYEPAAELLLTGLLQRYIELLIYQALLTSSAAEQAARMVAMKSATDNAANLIEELSMVYNKARQAAITQEISEIVGGSNAV